MVFYRPIENGVEIIRVLHGARDIERIFGGGFS
jgi:plasmid stabilization system protein ParE